MDLNAIVRQSTDHLEEGTNVGDASDDRIENAKGLKVGRIDCIKMGHRSIYKVDRIDGSFHRSRNRLDLEYFLLCVLGLSLNWLVIARCLIKISRL